MREGREEEGEGEAIRREEREDTEKREQEAGKRWEDREGNGKDGEMK